MNIETGAFQSSRFLSLLLILASVGASGVPGVSAHPKQYLDVKMTADRNLADEAKGDMRIDALETAEILKIRPLVERIRSEKKARNGDSAQLPKTIQQARLLCLWKIMTASQEVRKAKGDIDFELAKSNEHLDKLSLELNNTINLINTLNFAQGGTLGVTRQSMGLHHRASPVARQEIAITAFSTSTVLGASTLILPSFFKKRITTAPNSLAYIYEANRAPVDANRSYLWRFLNAPMHEPGLTRKQILVKHWQDFAGANPNDETKVRKLSSSLTQDERMTENIGLLRQRIGLLQDLKTHIEEFDGCLFELHEQISFPGTPG